MKNRNILLFMLGCVLTLMACEKDPMQQVNPTDYNITNELMGCRWVREYIHTANDDKRSDTARITETLIFTSDSTAKYYYEYSSPHRQDNTQYSSSIRYSIIGGDASGIVLAETWITEDSAPDSNPTRGSLIYDRATDCLAWNRSNGLYTQTFIRR